MGKWCVESYPKSDRSSLPTVESRKILPVCSSLAEHLLLEGQMQEPRHDEARIMLCPRDLGAITREIQGTCRRHSCSHTGQSTQVTAVKDGANGLGLARWVGGWVGEDLNPARVRDAVASLFILFVKVGNEGKESGGVLPLPMRPGEPGQGSPSLSLPVLPIALFICYPARTFLPDFPFCLLSPLPISSLHLCLPSLSSPPGTSRST